MKTGVISGAAMESVVASQYGNLSRDLDSRY